MENENSEKRAVTHSTIIPQEFDNVVVWAAWMYYVDELTQNEIAQIIGVSRVTVIKMLQEARSNGIVSIRINPEIVSRAQLSRSLAKRFGITSATIIPDVEGIPLERRLGEAAALVLADYVTSEDVIGVAWGRTVLETAKAISLTSPVSPLTVVQVTGSSTGNSVAFSPELCSSLLANRISARCINLLAPAMLSTSSLRDQILAEPSIQKQFSFIRSANRILFGVGDLGPQATVRQAELFDGATIDAFVAKGAVAAIVGHLIDSEGHPVPGEIYNRIVGIELDELKSIPFRLCVAGGQHKIQAIAAMLKGGYATNLVTDLATAKQLLLLA
eukprot:gene10651-10722_t